MAETLRRLDKEADPDRQMFLSDRRAELFRRRLAEAGTTADQIRAWIQYAAELMNAGNSAPAIEELAKLRKRVSQPDIRLNPKGMRQIGETCAIAKFRLGEQENCIANHNINSCLMPIRGSGVHMLPNGSRSAIEELLPLLAGDPNDLRSRWLLNLAYMTLGEYPDHVPPEYLIPPSAFESDYPLPRFYDVAGQCGLAKVGLAGGVATDDFNDDGYIDVISSSWGLLDQIRYFQNNQDGAFIDKTEAAGLIGVTGGLNLSHADYDNDGHLDLLVLRGAWLRDQGHHPSSLLHNNGDGTFEDVTEQAGLMSFHPSQAGTWGDYDNDGRLDLFKGNESSAGENHPCELFHNNGNGTFTEVAAAVGVAKVAFVKGAGWGDYNNDGRLDLYLSTLGQPNVLYRNDGPVEKDGVKSWRFTDVTQAAGVGPPLESFPTWFWDYDNDGWLDIMVTSYPTMVMDRLSAVVKDYLRQPHEVETARLFRNNHNGTFTDVTVAMGMNRVIQSMGANFGDLDNDGWLDAYFGTGDPELMTLIPNLMFRNAEGKKFQDVTTAGGFGHLQKGHGVAFVDLDNDGDQDVYEVMGGAITGDVFQSSLYENPGFGHHWITLRLEGVKSNRSAIGTRIKVTVETDSGTRDIYPTVSTGGSFGSASLQQEIGLGAAKAIKSIELVWPASGIRQEFAGVGMDQILRIRETDASPSVVKLKTYDLSPQNPEDAPCPLHAKPAAGQATAVR